MKMCDSVLSRVFLYGLPLVMVLGVLCQFYGGGAMSQDAHPLTHNPVIGLVFAIWMLLSIYLSIRLIASGAFRELALTKLTFMRERDERESMITGKATRITFLTTLAVLVFVFCLSCFQVSVYRVPRERAVNGKTGIVTLGVRFDLADHSASSKESDPDVKHLFFYQGLPVSTPAIILFLILWQIVSYNYWVRRLVR